MKKSDVINLKINGTVYNHNLSDELRRISDLIDKLKEDDWDGSEYYRQVVCGHHNLKWEIEKC